MCEIWNILQKNTKSKKKFINLFMRTCIFLCVNVYFKHKYFGNNFMLKVINLRIAFLASVMKFLSSLKKCYSHLVSTLNTSEELLDRMYEHRLVHSILKYKAVQTIAVFLFLSVLVFGLLVMTSDALVVEAQGRYISEQKFISQVDQDTPDAIFFSKKERLNE